MDLISQLDSRERPTRHFDIYPETAKFVIVGNVREK